MTLTTVDSQHRSGRRAVIAIAATAVIVGIAGWGISARPGSVPSPEQNPSVRLDPSSYVAALAAASPVELAAAFGNTTYNPYATSTDEQLAAAYGNTTYNPYATSTDEELAAAYGNTTYNP